MERQWRLFLALLWFGYMICGGLYLFSNGFLLTKMVQNERATCAGGRLTDKNVDAVGNNVNSSSAFCLEAKSKVIILLVDALKYEFGVYNESLVDSEAAAYQNKLKTIHMLRNREPERSRLFRFVADPPTTTLQRLKGLTTGTLPTFIDMGGNFATPEINEDNIIDQLKADNRTMVFMGDSTWTDLFPGRFTRQYSFPSFNIFDLDSVDREIEKILPKELEKDDWQLLVAHLLGVDHCGHKHGPNHPEMARKLTEMDNLIEDVVRRMDKDTVLFVIGDHGMTDSGDHGGESDDETNALLFAYSKGATFFADTKSQDSIQQIDFVPVLSAILGVPVPFSNLGALNINLVPDVSVFKTWSKYQVMLHHLWQNAKQMQNYFDSYAANHQSTFDEDTLDMLENKFLVLSYRVGSIYTDGAFQKFEQDLQVHLRKILHICREMWVKFDSQSMMQGLLIVAVTIFFLFLLITNLTVKQLDETFSMGAIQTVFLLNIGTAVFLYIGNTQVGFATGQYNAILVTNMMNVFILAFMVVQRWLDIVDRWNESVNGPLTPSNILARVIVGVMVAVYFSNSFIVQEQKIVTYLVTGILLYQSYQLMRQFKYSLATKWNYRLTLWMSIGVVGYCLFLLRMSYLYFRCREEQGEDCNTLASGVGGGGMGGFSRFLSTHLKLGSLCNKIDVSSIVSVACFVTVSRLYLQSCGAFMGYSFKVLLTKFGPTLMAICIGAHFVLANNKLATAYQFQIDAMAWVVYGLFLVQTIMTVWQPLMVYLMAKSKTADSGEASITQLYHKLRTMYQRVGGGGKKATIPIVYGLPTVYSCCLITYLVFIVLLLTLLLGANAANGLFIALTVTAVLLIVQSILKYNSSASIERLMNPSFLALATWLVLMQFTFYVTSHQPTLSQIDWHAAFVGRTYRHDHSNVLSAILVLANTFGGVILYGLFCPLLLMVPFLLYAKQPLLKDAFPRDQHAGGMHKAKRADQSGSSSGSHPVPDYKIETLMQNDEAGEDDLERDFDVTRGELNLYENARCVTVSMFRVAAKLMMLQGLRMFCSMLACTIHCRHLMVWKIFAPRFIYEGIATYMLVGMLLLGYLLLTRTHNVVERLIARLTKVD